MDVAGRSDIWFILRATVVLWSPRRSLKMSLRHEINSTLTLSLPLLLWNTQSNYAEDSAPNVPAPTSPSPEEVTGESSRSTPAPDKASDPPREKRMRGAESDRELYQLVQQSAAALHSLKKRQSSETVLWAQSVAFRLDSLPPFERAQARVRIEQVLLEAEFPGGRSQEIEESGGRMFLNL
ncbi:hypothetical protein SKAU_G00425540 [Synaphobranchus kaupii]|uniref:Uncharacterized protein n=1 Tax=Synaphobranchus kaupii TaxID=118154 RepID=A0A9Q1E516_SYNKA|nr:hypothetical protein SKAU_G00425540 [Synaphobranchus kaupii]